jgi:hypothetical protein
MAFRATLLRRWLVAVRRAETLESERNFHGGKPRARSNKIQPGAEDSLTNKNRRSIFIHRRKALVQKQTFL